MKSHIPGNNDGRILLYGYTHEESVIFEDELRRRGLNALRVEIIPENAAGRQLGSLAGIYQFCDGNADETPAEAVRGSCVIFSGFASNQLDKALAALRSCGISAPLKAALTPHNAELTLAQLIAELKREHKSITGEEL